MKKYFFTDKFVLTIYIAAVPVMALTSAFFAKAMEPLLDEAILQQGTSVRHTVLFFIGIGLLDMAACYIHKLFREKLRTSFLIGLKRDVFSGILKMEFDTFRKETPAYYVSLMQRDMQKISTDYFDSICGIYRVLACFLVTFLLLMDIDPLLCLLNVLISFLSVALPQALEKKIQYAAKEATDNAAAYQSVVSDALFGFNTIRIFSIADKINQQIEVRNKNYEKSEYKSVTLNYSVSYLSVICSQIGFIATMSIGAVLVLNGAMTVGAVVAVSQLIGGILAPFQELPIFLANLQSVKVIKEKMEGILQENERTDLRTPIDYGDTCRLSFQDVGVSYGEKQILRDITVDFKENETYVLVGESGSGKSTLAKLLMRMAAKQCGELRIGEKDFSELPDEQLYRIVNYMQQEIFLFDDTLWNNITLYQDYPADEVERVIDCAGLRDYVAQLDDGLYTRISGNGYNLSGGQKQRIGLARSLLSGAKIIILDEITSNLDVVLEKKVENTIMQLKDVTVIMITHRLNRSTLQKADHILVLKDKTIAEMGTFDALMEKKGLLYAYYSIGLS